MQEETEKIPSEKREVSTKRNHGSIWKVGLDRNIHVVETRTPNDTKTDLVKPLVIAKKLKGVTATTGTRELTEGSRMCRGARRRMRAAVESGGSGEMIREQASSGGGLHGNGGGSGGGLIHDGGAVTIKTMEREQSCFRGRRKARRSYGRRDPSEQRTLGSGPERVSSYVSVSSWKLSSYGIGNTL